MVEITAIKIVSICLQIVLLAVDKFSMPKAQPTKVQEPIVFFVSAVSLVATSLDLPFYHYLLATNVWIIIGVLLTFAVAPPIAGIIEAKLRNNTKIYERDRFNAHLRNNIIGSAAAAAFILAGRWTSGFDAYTVTFKNEAAFNIVLPLTVITIFAFVRWQQEQACPKLQELMDAKDPTWEGKITGFSLRYVNQLLNALYLILITFTGAGTVLYMFAFTVVQAKDSHPIALSWPLAIAMVAIMAFLLACGLPSMKKFDAVYLNFLTGAPAALMVIVVWIALLEKSTVRNVFALCLVIFSYATYSLLVIAANRQQGKKRSPLHYYSSMAFAVALTLLTSALYVS